MIYAGCDVGSVSAKAVVMKDDSILSWHIVPSKGGPEESARTALQQALEAAGLAMGRVDRCCGTGYGRMEIKFADMNVSEISCHGLGAFWSDSTIRTVIDIGGQDCKVIALDGNGMVRDFIMNDKCAAGTGRSLEILSRTLDIPLDSLGPLACRSRRPVTITNKCGIFMELEVIDALYKGKKPRDIASGLSDSVARRVASLARSVDLHPNICITGGVSKNRAVVRCLEKRMGSPFRILPWDGQITGALGAALHASGAYSYQLKEIIGL